MLIEISLTLAACIAFLAWYWLLRRAPVEKLEYQDLHFVSTLIQVPSLDDREEEQKYVAGVCRLLTIPKYCITSARLIHAESDIWEFSIHFINGGVLIFRQVGVPICQLTEPLSV